MEDSFFKILMYLHRVGSDRCHILTLSCVLGRLEDLDMVYEAEATSELCLIQLTFLATLSLVGFNYE